MGAGTSHVSPTNESNGVATVEPPQGSMLMCDGWCVPKCVRSWSSSAMVRSEKLAVPPPGPGQVRVKVYAASVNPVDLKRATLFGNGNKSKFFGGTTPDPSRHTSLEFPFPYVMGVDGAGIVESVGWETKDEQEEQQYPLKVGDHVVFVADMMQSVGGTFCQYALAHADAVSKFPISSDNRVIDFVEAAAIPTAVGAAYVALFDKLRVEPGRNILISGASGGVGSAAVQLSKHAGLYVIASCSTVNVEYVKKLGADIVLDYTVADIVGGCLARTRGIGVDYVLEVAKAELAVQHADALRFGGAMCVLPGPVPPCGNVFFLRQLSLSYVFLGGLYKDPLSRVNLRRVLEASLQLYQLGVFKLELETVPFWRAEIALDVVATGHTRGKIVLTDFHLGEVPSLDGVAGTHRMQHHEEESGTKTDFVAPTMITKAIGDVSLLPH